MKLIESKNGWSLWHNRDVPDETRGGRAVTRKNRAYVEGPKGTTWNMFYPMTEAGQQMAKAYFDLRAGA